VLDVAGVLAFAPRWVEQLAARYNAHGPDALGDQRRRNGRAASVLTPALLSALAERLRAPPADGGRWTGPKVAIWMARHLGLERGAPAARLGGAAAGAVVDPGAAAAPPAGGDA
jgi:Homeodomain-like domain